MSRQRALERFRNRLLLHSDLTDEEQEVVLTLDGEEQRVAAHRDLVTPGSRTGHATLTVDGLIARYQQMRDGGRQLVAFHIPGDMGDLHSTALCWAGWGMTALTDSTVLKIPHQVILSQIERYPAIGRALWRDTTFDANVLAQWVANIGRADAKARLAHLFCELGIRSERAELGTRERYPLQATQEQIGDAMGLTAVHVNRSLRVLRELGAADVRGGMVSVTDRATLERVANFDPTYLYAGEPVPRVR